MTTKDVYRREYLIRLPVEGRKSFVVTMPYEIIEREARQRGLTIEEFLAKYIAVAQYGNTFEGVLYTFEATIV